MRLYDVYHHILAHARMMDIIIEKKRPRLKVHTSDHE